MGLNRAWRERSALVACGLLLTACTATDHGTRTGEPPAPAHGSNGSPAGDESLRAPGAQADPAGFPRTTAQARALVRKVIADPELIGPDAERGTPYESDPATWAVLDDGCTWRRERLPGDVLATLTRHFEMPDGHGRTARLTATVTVHRTALQAAWEQAGVLDEAMACPQQTLRPGERLTGLRSSAFAFGEGSNDYSDDELKERGQCRDERGGPYAYFWTQAAFGPVVLSTSSCGGRDEDSDPFARSASASMVRMLGRAKAEIGGPAARRTGTSAPGAGAGGA
ncbi:hypothetical protein GCM10018793_57570 [Streptomyces sulfonofaciens]|uniref:Lipoprotein n=1 Tax=Streptomyces sulfonofaciens TaxID=68272 RepID=A0A919GKH5_9ACTN|nr:hypothetical protein [Streptomyces sulfonofaciens]GHH86287.1 hypothetical protein GCM10018793_57570 [Streptomyces sulfonofaciens]